MGSRVAKVGAASVGVLAGVCAALYLPRPAPEPAPPSAIVATSSGGRVRIDSVEPPEQVPGGLVVLRGRGFSIFASDDALQDIKSYQRALAAVSITAGGLSAGQPNELADGRAQVLLPPELRPGRARIVLSVGGEWAAAEVEVVSRLAVPEREPGDASPGFLSLGKPHLNRFGMGDAAVLFDGGAEGLPDGCVIEARLTLGDADVASCSAEVNDGRFEGCFVYEGKELFGGEYWVEAQFALEKQARAVREKFPRAFANATNPPMESKRHEHGGARRSMQVGTSATIAACEREQAAIVATAAARGRALLEELALAYGAAGRSGFAPGGKVDEAAWAAWLEARALTAFAQAEHAARREAMRARRDLVSEGGGLAVARWRAIADATRDEIGSRQRDAEAFRGRFVLPGDAEALKRAATVWATLTRLATGWSRELYRNAGLPPDDARDPQVALESAAGLRNDLDWLDRWRAEQANSRPR